MIVEAKNILPSQDFLKEKTVRSIFQCILTGSVADLPPTPLVRPREGGELVAIDGHNLIAVLAFLGRQIEVKPVESASDGLPETSEANRTRNQELATKFDGVLDEQERVAIEGVGNFEDLIAKYPEIFTSDVATQLATRQNVLE